MTNLRVLQWLKEMTSDPNETNVTIQDVDRESMKHIKTDSCFQSRFNIRYAIDGDLDGYFCPGSGGRTYPTEKLLIKKL